MKLIALLFTLVASAWACESLSEAVEKLKSPELLRPLELTDTLQFIQSQIHGVGTAGSSILISELVDSGLIDRIINNYKVETFEEVLKLKLFGYEVLFAPFKSIQSSLGTGHPLYEHYKLLCKQLALSITNNSEVFSIDAVDMKLRFKSGLRYYREVLFGLIDFRTIEYADLTQLLGSDPFMELARVEFFEVLLAAILKFRIPPTSRVRTAQFGPKLESLNQYTAPVNPELSQLL